MAAALAKLNEPQWCAPKLPPDVELRDSNINQYERLIYNAMSDYRGFYDLVEQPADDMPRDGTPHIYDHRLIDRNSLDEDDLSRAAFNIVHKLIMVHTKGTPCRGPADPTNLKGNETERDTLFHDRLAQICEALTKFKSLVLQCIDEPGNVVPLVVLAPKYALDSRIASMRNNDIKAAKTRANKEEKMLTDKQIAQALKRKEKAKKEKLAKATKPAPGPDAHILQSQDPRQQNVLKAASHEFGLRKIADQPFFDYVSPNGHNITAETMQPSVQDNESKGGVGVEADEEVQDGNGVGNHQPQLKIVASVSVHPVPLSVSSADIASDHSPDEDARPDKEELQWMGPVFDPAVDYGNFSLDAEISSFDSADFGSGPVFDNNYDKRPQGQIDGENSAGDSPGKSTAQTSNDFPWLEDFGN
jgi:hypothetical protein